MYFETIACTCNLRHPRPQPNIIFSLFGDYFSLWDVIKFKINRKVILVQNK